MMCDVNFTVFSLSQEVFQNRQDLDFLTAKKASKWTKQTTQRSSL